MAQLAIKGHSTRGKEVIQLLEMLGGKNTFHVLGTEYGLVCYIDDKNNIFQMQINDYNPCSNYTIFTLEEFLEKFPYKVGDKVTLDDKLCSITWMCWECNNIYYQVQGIDTMFTKKVTVNDLQPYKEENYCQVIGNDTSSNGVNTSASSIDEEPEPEPEPKAPILSNRYDYAEGKCGYVIPDGYEFDSIKEGFQTEIILKPKKPTYPKTYSKCCKVLGFRLGDNIDNLEGYKSNLLEHLQVLLICRDAYWKIAGEEMNLGKPWEPDWNDLSATRVYIKINKGCLTYASRVFVFPTAEMRDAFYENFKNLIEDCKSLL